MRLDEMVIKANLPENKGKTYVCGEDGCKYSAKDGFETEDILMYIDSWEEEPKRHLTVSEAEKELDCVIDVNCKNLSLRSPKDLPKPYRNVVVLYKISKDSEYTGYCNKHGSWFASGEDGSTQIPEPLCWIDPDDILKLLPKG